MSPSLRGILLIILSGICFSVMTAVSKHLGARLGIFEVAFFRSAFGWLFVWPFVARAGLQALKTSHPLAHVTRGIASGCSVLAIFYSVMHLPLAEASAYGFTRNLFIVVLAAIFLREPIRRDRTAVALLGFIGVLLMLRPQAGLTHQALTTPCGFLCGTRWLRVGRRVERAP